MDASGDPHSSTAQPNLPVDSAPSVWVGRLMESIERLQSQTQTLEEDSGARMQQVESIQDDCVQQYITSLTANRQTSPVENPVETPVEVPADNSTARRVA